MERLIVLKQNVKDELEKVGVKKQSTLRKITTCQIFSVKAHRLQNFMSLMDKHEQEAPYTLGSSSFSYFHYYRQKLLDP